MRIESPMRIRREGREEGGFTVAEILIAGVIMVIALVPMVRMFDTSFKGIRAFEQSQKSVSCAKTALEQIQAMPFYTPHTVDVAGESWDIDDRFWGDRNPINSNPVPGEGVPDWEQIPKVEFYDYGGFGEFPDFRVDVQLAYLDDDLGVAEMHDEWAPKASGLDRPTNSANATLQMVLVRVSVYWKDSPESQENSYNLDSIVGDTQAIYNFGSARVTVDQISNPDAVLNPNRPNAAAHWPPVGTGVKVIIEGWGFDPDTIVAHIVRYKYADLPINLTYKSETRLEGTINLASNVPPSLDPNEPNWANRAAVGYWTVKTRQENLFSSYLYNGFIVEYPKPNIKRYGNASDMGVRMGTNNDANAWIKVEGSPFINLIDKPAVRLIRENEEGVVLDLLAGQDTQIVVPAGTYGYTNDLCTITARFDFTTASAGEYYLQVVNTKEPTLVGHRASDYDEFSDGVSDHENKYTITEYRPVVDDIIVSASPEARTAYKNKGNPWSVTISGSRFNTIGSPPVEIYLCSAVAGELPAGAWVKGTVVTVPDSGTINGTFDVSTLPLGSYIVYVRNLINGLAGWTDGAPLLVGMMEGIDSFTPDSYPAFYENYYDIAATINGYGLAGATKVSFSNGSLTYDADEYTVNGNTSISAKLNLINCPNGNNWTLRVQINGGEKVFTTPFSISLGRAVILPPSDTKHAIKINSSNNIGSYESLETTVEKAFAVTSPGNSPKAVFEVRGMGFPISGTTELKVWGTIEGVAFTRTASCSTNALRENKLVWIKNATSWNMPETQTSAEVLCNISVERLGSGIVDSYTQRWRLVKI